MRLASRRAAKRARECTTWGFLMTKPSFTSCGVLNVYVCVEGERVSRWSGRVGERVVWCGAVRHPSDRSIDRSTRGRRRPQPARAHHTLTQHTQTQTAHTQPPPTPTPFNPPIHRPQAKHTARVTRSSRQARGPTPTLRMFWRELAMEISAVSLGSSQTLRLPVLSTDAARRFCSRRFTIFGWVG